MADKLNEDELLDECISVFNSELAKINYQRSFHRDDSFLSCKWERVNQAKEEIKALIKKPQVTEGWFRQMVREMKESLKDGLRYYPREDDIKKLEQIRASKEVTEEWIEEKAWKLYTSQGTQTLLEYTDFIRSLVKEITK